ncbi:hypothetical protein, partial [Solemya pervernicosa gill symbiont]|uniref:hypothetical protein n=1 Tax=Solemya pervernicosa gill symbiont TaxID=642797 RepID=UPI001F3C2BE4
MIFYVPFNRDGFVLYGTARGQLGVNSKGVPIAIRGQIGESLFLRKLVLGIQAQASGKYLTRPFMPTAP